MTYYRPVVTDQGEQLAGGWSRFASVEVMERGQNSQRVPLSEVPVQVMDRLTAPRADLMGLSMAAPQVMGIINATPDSFSDGGDHFDPSDAVARAIEMAAHGSTIIDIGGESTRPGAEEVPVAEELRRVAGVVQAVRERSNVALSIDTRKAGVAGGVGDPAPWMVNDVSAFRFDPDLADMIANAGVPVCLMHSIGTPETMQANAAYDDVLLDVYDHLEERITLAESYGIQRDKIIVDPGIGFGKTLDHNLVLLRGISLFHALGCPILLGASRKRFIGTIGKADAAKDRLGGSISVALHGVRQGVQILRVHDTFATKQAIDLHMAIGG